jgi:thiamine-phosphate pyrophosphorylase
LDKSEKPGRSIVAGNRPLFYYITDRSQLTGESLPERIRTLLQFPVDFIQIREKDLTDLELYDLTCRAVSLARDTRCRILVNGRADIALAAGAHGVHLPSYGLRTSDLSPWIPAGFIIGSSVHSLREAREAWNDGADYALVGHVFPTKSKAAYGPPLGLGCLQEICSSVPIPVFGLGGIKAELVNSVLEAGAAGIAGITLFQDNAQITKLFNLECGSLLPPCN